MAAVENSVRFPPKLPIECPYDPAIPFLGMLLKGLEVGTQTGIYTSMFTALLPRWLRDKESAHQWRRRFDLWVGKIP